jgi:hypothetical protein
MVEYAGWVDRAGYQLEQATGYLPSKIAADGVPNGAVNPVSNLAYLEARRDVIVNANRQRPLIRLWDKNMKFLCVVAGELSHEDEELAHDSGQLTTVIRREDWIGDYLARELRVGEDLHITVDPNPTKRSWRTRWGGKVTALSDVQREDGSAVVEIKAIHMREHLKYILIGSNPIFPPEVQPLQMFIWPMNCRTGVASALFVNLARQYWPLLSVVDNVFNPGSWLTTRVGNMSPLNWPVQVAFVNPLTDQSRFSIIGAKWQDAHSVFGQNLKDAGCIIRAYTWLTEDDDTPHEELNLMAQTVETGVEDLLTPVLGGQWADDLATAAGDAVEAIGRPWRNCVVLSVEDVSGVKGPTGTLADGVINFVAATGDDLITETLYPVDKDGDGQTDPLIRLLAGVAPEKPRVVFRESEYCQILEATRTVNKARGVTTMVGGKSPKWVNDLQTFGIKYGLSQLSAIISAAVFGAYQVPGTPGLEELYQGQLDNILLAYQRFTNFMRAAQAGDYAFLERMSQGSGTAYTLSGVLALRSGDYDGRAYVNFTVKLASNGPVLVYEDIQLGERALFEKSTIMYADNLTAIKRQYDESTALNYSLSIGDDSSQEDPVAIGLRAIQGISSALESVIGGAVA